MKKNVKSKGRKKNVTSGKGSVYKRGDGLNVKKPVGNSSAYKDRKQSKQSSSQSSNNTSLGNMFGSSQSQESGQRVSSGLNLKRIITIAIIVIIGYFVLKSCMNIDLLESMGTVPSDDTAISDNSAVSNNSSSSSGDLDYTVSNDARSKYTDVLGNGQDEFTIMVYI